MNFSIKAIEQESLKNSFIHKIDGRVKIFFSLMIIVYAIYTTSFIALFLLELYILSLLLFSKVSIKFFIKRILLVLPFGLFIAILQPFIKEGSVLFTFFNSITVTYEGLIFGLLLLIRLIVCLSSIVLLSSISPLNDIVKSMGKLGFPNTLTTILIMSIRYLFLFFDEINNILKAQNSRGFDIWNKKTSYLWRLKHIGYTIILIFLNAYDRGEKIYYSMMSRAFSGETIFYYSDSKIESFDYIFLIFTILLILFLEIIN